MGITEDPDPAMATMAKTLPFTTVDTDIPITVDTDIPITVDTDTIVIRTGAGNTPKVTRIVRQERQGWPLGQAADARGRPISGMSALRRLRPRVRSGVGPKITKARCRTRRKIKRIRLHGRSTRPMCALVRCGGCRRCLRRGPRPAGSYRRSRRGVQFPQQPWRQTVHQTRVYGRTCARADAR
jgi:hypothetical protein